MQELLQAKQVQKIRKEPFGSTTQRLVSVRDNCTAEQTCFSFDSFYTENAVPRLAENINCAQIAAYRSQVLSWLIVARYRVKVSLLAGPGWQCRVHKDLPVMAFRWNASCITVISFLSHSIACNRICRIHRFLNGQNAGWRKLMSHRTRNLVLRILAQRIWACHRLAILRNVQLDLNIIIQIVCTIPLSERSLNQQTAFIFRKEQRLSKLGGNGAFRPDRPGLTQWLNQSEFQLRTYDCPEDGSVAVAAFHFKRCN